ncbi:16S rRNA (cytosine(1402)-N(4))-methyltransferase RsmH [Oscillatoriales cyanobacterium LEGE 11467]|uniref:Ribosomal RNA small subunit methyltransferase H n=1 Tax=Zarconia navalis LEGE 11467 TaxID=1828826 RepID=A0A928Z7W3_9CYAN|nr:16S rRNA (cytosine(1402)-N(4))-methyltransferase RsmH [Zarconia navalis]MBE9041842.1 16S rRNA (cytosine(1402)-N(4))-methyltransferase RsmH [Zarconia navalis LEGE 11467]
MTRSQTSNSNQNQTGGFSHVPVLLGESIAGLAVRPGGHYLDATVGAGGHTRSILEAASDVRVTAIDRDDEAISTARGNLAEYRDRLEFWQGNFADFPPSSDEFDGIIADLGVSSGQLDIPERGFSFRHTAPLDMRMDRQQSLTADEIINHWDERKLADIFYHYGEERFSRRIARAIVGRRPFQTTTDLAAAIARTLPSRYRYVKIHPATRVFQALRIAVNEELASLETLLDRAPSLLKVGGRIGVISFHSLEDRRVKHGFRDDPQLGVLTKKPIVPQGSEQVANPRSRSAKLRVAERLNVRSTT